MDERLTTRAAAGTLRAEGRRARDQRGVIDQNAAALLLQTWVEQRLSAEGTGRVRTGERKTGHPSRRLHRPGAVVRARRTGRDGRRHRAGGRAATRCCWPC